MRGSEFDPWELHDRKRKEKNNKIREESTLPSEA